MAAPMGTSDDDVFGKLNLFEEFSSKQRTAKKPDTNDQSETEKTNLEAEISRLKQENLRLQSWMKVCIQAKGYKVSEGTKDGPIAQVVFMNHDSVCKYRHEVENFFEHLCARSFYQQMERKNDDARPLPQRASMVLTENPDPASREAFTATGNVQYYLLFCLDTLGRPLVDGDAQLTEGWEIPPYPIIFREALPIDDKPSAPKKGGRAKASCFNCGNEKHSLRECPLPRDLVKISQNKRLFMDQMGSSPANTISGRRYHKDGGEQGGAAAERFKKFKPGVISEALSQALGLSPRQLPPFIYGMRRLGYPPGHLLDAQVHKSDLKVYNIKDTDEEGEVPGNEEEEGVKQPSYILKKLVDYPGFNVDADQSIIEEWRNFNSMPMQNSQRKEVMKLHLGPMAVEEEENVTPRNKRPNKDFNENSSSKKRRIEEDSVDMDISKDEYPETPVRGWFQPPLPPTPEIATPPPLPPGSAPATPVRGWFQPPLPPTPDIATPPPLPPGSAPPTPVRDSPTATSLDDSLPWRSSNNTSRQTSQSASRQDSQASSQSGSRCGSPDLDLLMTERTKLLAALETGTDDSTVSSSDAIPSGVDTTEEEEDEEVESDRSKNAQLGQSKQGEAHARTNGGGVDSDRNGDVESDGFRDKNDDATDRTTEDESIPEVSSKESPDSPDADPKPSLDSLDMSQLVVLDSTEGESSVFMSQEDEEEEEEMPNKSGVPHRRKFSVNITPHVFDEDEQEKKGIFKKLLGILKRDKK